MGRRCTICDHPDREAIDVALVKRTSSVPSIATLFDASQRALYRHRENHLPEILVKAQQVKETARATDLMGELESCFRRMNLMFDACDRWLQDPENSEQYDIGPRAADISVIYWEDGPSGKRVKRKARLSSLLPRVTPSGRTIELVETRHADPRELILKTAARLQAQLELLAKLMGELAQEGTVTITLSAEWIELRTIMLQVLAPYPDARLALRGALRPEGAGGPVGGGSHGR